MSFACAARYWSNQAGNIANVIDSENIISVYSDKPKMIETNFLGFNPAQDFVSTNNAYPASGYYGVALGQPSGITKWEASTAIFNYMLEYFVEFLGMQ